MAEAEDVIVDAARHASSYAMGLWRRNRAPSAEPPGIAHADVRQRLELFVEGALRVHVPIRTAPVRGLAPDLLLGAILEADAAPTIMRGQEPGAANAPGRRLQTTRLARRPRTRRADDDEDDAQTGLWMIQTTQPHEHAEDAIERRRGHRSAGVRERVWRPAARGCRAGTGCMSPAGRMNPCARRTACHA